MRVPNLMSVGLIVWKIQAFKIDLGTFISSTRFDECSYSHRLCTQMVLKMVLKMQGFL